MRARPPAAPYHALEVVRAATRVYVGGGRARAKVMERFEALRKPLSAPEAERFVREMARALTVEAFVETKELQCAEALPVLADIYGVRDRHGDWYVKLYMRGRDVVVISCHEPEGTLVRNDGLRIGKPRK
jgi:hypothetical protein